MDECQYRKDWPKWKDYIHTKLESLEKWEVFGPIVQMPEVVKLVGYKWVFIRKCNGKNVIMRYKACNSRFLTKTWYLLWENIFSYDKRNHI